MSGSEIQQPDKVWLFSDFVGSCSGCHGEATNFKSIPLLGSFCDQCIEKLNKPVLYEGAISGESVVFLAEKMQKEFVERTGGLRNLMLHSLGREHD